MEEYNGPVIPLQEEYTGPVIPLQEYTGPVLPLEKQVEPGSLSFALQGAGAGLETTARMIAGMAGAGVGALGAGVAAIPDVLSGNLEEAAPRIREAMTEGSQRAVAPLDSASRALTGRPTMYAPTEMFEQALGEGAESVKQQLGVGAEIMETARGNVFGNPQPELARTAGEYAFEAAAVTAPFMGIKAAASAQSLRRAKVLEQLPRTPPQGSSPREIARGHLENLKEVARDSDPKAYEVPDTPTVIEAELTTQEAIRRFHERAGEVAEGPVTETELISNAVRDFQLGKGPGGKQMGAIGNLRAGEKESLGARAENWQWDVPERTVHSPKWVYHDTRWHLEAAGDLYREIAKQLRSENDFQFGLDYIFEKYNRLKRYTNYSDILFRKEYNKAKSPENEGSLSKITSEWNQAPIDHPLLKVARDVNLSIAHGDKSALIKNLETLQTLLGQQAPALLPHFDPFKGPGKKQAGAIDFRGWTKPQRQSEFERELGLEKGMGLALPDLTTPLDIRARETIQIGKDIAIEKGQEVFEKLPNDMGSLLSKYGLTTEHTTKYVGVDNPILKAFIDRVTEKHQMVDAMREDLLAGDQLQPHGVSALRYTKRTWRGGFAGPFKDLG